MSPVERYRVMVETRCGSAGNDALARTGRDAYLHTASLHAPTGELVYSRDQIIHFFQARSRPEISPRQVASEVFAAEVPAGTLLAARVVSNNIGQAELSLSMALMRGERINEEWLFEASPGSHALRMPDRVMLDLARPTGALRTDPGKRGLVESGLDGGFCGLQLAHAGRECIEALHRACVGGDPDAWLQSFVDTPILNAAGNLALASGRSSLLAFYQQLWRRFDNRCWYVERAAESSHRQHIAILWRLTGTCFDGIDTLGASLPGLTFWSLDDSGRIERETTLFDEAAFERERAARAAAWKP